MDLFDNHQVKHLPLPDGELTQVLQPGLPAGPEVLLRELLEETPWRQEHITLWGKTHPQPRLSAWYGDSGAGYRYSGLQLTPLPWTPRLQAIRRCAEAAAGVRFNSVLLNLYRDGRDSMGMHADDEPELGEHPLIASLSLGEERPLLFRHKRRRELGTVRVPQPDGSLLIMAGATQREWKHGINKQRPPCGPRINLTFRRILSTTNRGA